MALSPTQLKQLKKIQAKRKAIGYAGRRSLKEIKGRPGLRKAFKAKVKRYLSGGQKVGIPPGERPPKQTPVPVKRGGKIHLYPGERPRQIGKINPPRKKRK